MPIWQQSTMIWWQEIDFNGQNRDIMQHEKLSLLLLLFFVLFIFADNDALRFGTTVPITLWGMEANDAISRSSISSSFLHWMYGFIY